MRSFAFYNIDIHPIYVYAAANAQAMPTTRRHQTQTFPPPQMRPNTRRTKHHFLYRSVTLGSFHCFKVDQHFVEAMEYSCTRKNLCIRNIVRDDTKRQITHLLMQVHNINRMSWFHNTAHGPADLLYVDRLKLQQNVVPVPVQPRSDFPIHANEHLHVIDHLYTCTFVKAHSSWRICILIINFL